MSEKKHCALFRSQAEQLVQQMTLEETFTQLRYDAPAIERLRIPAMNWWNEGLHGVARAGTATMFPQAIGLAAAFDSDLLRRVADTIATEARAKYNEAVKHGDRDIYKGLTLWSPNVNIFRDPRWGRGHETYGEDPFLTAQLGCAFVKGLQGEGIYWKAAACAKHFAVHSGPEALRHEFDARVSPKDLEETYLPAFRALVQKADVAGVMGAYNRVNGEPACASSFLSRMLYENWQFKGYFVSDCWALRDFHTGHCVTKTFEESAALALNYGCHLNCGCTYLYVQQAYEAGLVSEDVIREAVTRLMEVRLRLGLFAQTEYDRISYEAVDCPKHRALALEAAEKSMVLLENDGILPLDSETLGTLAVIGPNADSIGALRGNYYGTAAVNETFLQGIQAAFPGRVLYAKGCELCGDRTEPLALPYDRIAEAVTAAEHADAVILCLGLDETLEGEQGDEGNAAESGDKLDLNLPESQKKLLAAVVRVGKPLVIVTACGSAVTVPLTGVNAWLHVWYSGERGGTALANLLFGKTSPSGKLPITFYQTTDALPSFTDYSMRGRTYRYTTENVLYPFGYGLTYGRTAVRNLTATAESNGVRIVCMVENEGQYGTEDVLQVYWSSDAADAVPNKSLCAFQRMDLKPGRAERLELLIPWERFTVVDETGRRYFDQTASYNIHVMDQSVRIALKGKNDVV